MKKLLVAVVVACGFAAFANEWYIDAENGDDTAAGTQGAPRKTLKGAMEIPDLAENDTVWLLPGDYNVGEMPYFDAKVSGMTYASTNRCFITKPGLKIRSTGGKDVTFVTGEKDPNVTKFTDAYGGVRCFLIAAEAKGVVIEGLTIQTGYAPYVQASPYSFGGGVLDRSESCWVVDCKFSGGRASRGGGQAYGNALRTEYIDTAAEGRGTAVQDVNMLVNCAIRNTGGIAPVDGSASTLVNCLITATKAKTVLSRDAVITAYNSIFVGNTYGNDTKKASKFFNCVVGFCTNETVTCESCVTNATVDDVAWASTASPYDWRIASTSVARGVGDTAILATIQVPEGYSVYTDLYGTPIPEEGKIVAGPVQPMNWYVDAANGNDDDHGGKTPTDAFKTIRKATSEAHYGDTIYVAPGEYGEAESSESKASVLTRVIVPAGVRLQGEGGRYAAVIRGAAASEPEDAYGNGADAVRCVYLDKNATLANFTLTEGRTTAKGNGGAVYSANTTATVADCLVTNNACYAGTLYNGRNIRCRIIDNKASYRGALGYTGSYYGCFFDHSKAAARSLLEPSEIDFCTFGTHYELDGGSKQIIGPATKTVMRNTVMMAGRFYSQTKVYATNCVLHSDIELTSFGGYSNCVAISLKNMKLSADGVPTADSPVNNAGSVEFFPDCVNETDLLGVPRVLNGGVDAGAFEHDWRVDYAALLGSDVTVETASSAVHGTDDAVVVPSGSTLAGTLTRLGVYGAYKIAFQVSGGGTATLKLGGEVFGEYAAGDYAIEVKSSGEAVGFEFTFEGDGELAVRSVAFTGYWYIDGTRGNDNNDGRTPTTPKATIRAATTNAVAGEVIYVAPGVYGEKEGSQVATGQNIGNRVLLPAGVTLESLEGAEKTFIVGAADPDAYTENYGTGPKAIRCVHAVGVDTHIRGFTLTGGHTYSNATDGVSTDANGAAVYSTTSKSAYACVEDCIVSNNFCHGATLNSCRVIRSRVTKNRSIRGDDGTTGAAGSVCYWYGCIIDDNYGKAAMHVPKWIESCTIKQASGVSQVIFSDYSCVPINTVLLSGTTYKVISATNCMFQTGTSTIVKDYREGCIDCVITNAANMTVDADFRPVFGSYAGIDAGDVKYKSEYLGDKDIYGNPRVSNGKMDIGAVEYDWRGQYRKDLGARVTAVTGASPEVVETKNGTVRIPSGSLVATLKPGAAMLNFTVKGGTLEVYLGEKHVGTFEATEEVQQSVELWPSDENNAFRLAFTPSAEDGYAEIARLKKGENGIIFMVR